MPCIAGCPAKSSGKSGEGRSALIAGAAEVFAQAGHAFAAYRRAAEAAETLAGRTRAFARGAFHVFVAKGIAQADNHEDRIARIASECNSFAIAVNNLYITVFYGSCVRLSAQHDHCGGAFGGEGEQMMLNDAQASL